MKNKLFIELYFLIQAYLIFIITITTLFRDILFSKRYKILVELPLLTTSMLDFLLFSRNLRFITEIRFEDTVAIKITWYYETYEEWWVQCVAWHCNTKSWGIQDRIYVCVRRLRLLMLCFAIKWKNDQYSIMYYKSLSEDWQNQGMVKYILVQKYKRHKPNSSVKSQANMVNYLKVYLFCRYRCASPHLFSYSIEW